MSDTKRTTEPKLTLEEKLDKALEHIAELYRELHETSLQNHDYFAKQTKEVQELRNA